MKQLIGSDIGRYTFAPGVGITLFDMPAITLANLLLVINTTTGTMIYNFADPTLNGTVTGGNTIVPVLNTAGMSATDQLQIYCDLPMADPIDQTPMAVAPAYPGQKSINQAMPVALANEQIFDFQSPTISMQNPAVGTLLSYQDCQQYRSISVQIITGPGASGTIVFECSNSLADAQNWTSAQLVDPQNQSTAASTSYTVAASANKFFIGPVNFRYFRIRVSTAVVGSISVSAMYRMAPYSPLPGQQSNATIQTVAGTVMVNAGVAATLAVGGNIAPGLAQTANPLVAGGVDNAGLTRRVATDTFGNLNMVGPDPSKAAGTQPVRTREIDGDLGRYALNELLELILMELKLHSFYLKEMPMMLNRPGASYIEELADIITNADTRGQNG